MRKIALALSVLFLVGCATKLIVIERDAKGTVRTIEAEDYSVKTPTLIAVPSRWLTPTFVSEIFKGIIGWQSIPPAILPGPGPVPPIPEPGPPPTPPLPPYPAPEPTPIPAPAPAPTDTIFTRNGNNLSMDMNTIPGNMRGAGFQGRDNALYYALSNIYRKGPGPELSVKEGDHELARLSQQRAEIYDWFDKEVMKVRAIMIANSAMTVTAITYDAYDRLGCRLGPAIVDRLREFGSRVQLGSVLPEP